MFSTVGPVVIASFPARTSPDRKRKVPTASTTPIGMDSTRAIVSRRRRVVFGVVAVALVGFAARIAFLGDRTAHWDEARVAYWTLDYLRTGTFEYQPIIHGPFLQQVNRVVFAVLGSSDLTMRLIVVVLGSVLPLSALLFRERLHEVE